LVTLKAGKSVVAAVEALAPMLSNQDQPWLQTKISALKSAASSTGDAAITALKEEIKQLQERVAKLESESSQSVAKPAE
jgi:polyhydroxyalkanoate synthesis regulator phasin